MELYKTLISSPKFSKVITFEKEYSERIGVYKHESYVDYVITIKPANSDKLEITFEEDEQTGVVIEPIAKGIERAFSELNSDGIALKGVEISINNGHYWESDYHPGKYSNFTAKRFKEIVFEKGIKKITKPVDFRETDRETSFEKIPTGISKYNLFNYSIFKDFHLPNTLDHKLSIPQNLILKKEISSKDFRFKIQFSIVPNDFTYKHLNIVRIYAPERITTINAMFILFDGIENLIEDIYKNNYNLGGMLIYVHDSNIEYSGRQIDLTMDFYWFLKGLILRSNSIESI